MQRVLRGNLPESVGRHLDLDHLEVLQASFIDAQYAQSEADLLISVGIAGRPGFIYVLLEHPEQVRNALLMLRLLLFMVRVWRRHTRENPEEQRLPVILPLVVFHGPKGWQGRSISIPLWKSPADEFADYTPDFRINSSISPAHRVNPLPEAPSCGSYQTF